MEFHKDLELIPVADMSRAEWLIKRQEGLGGSDMSCLIPPVNTRFSAIELFYQKLGLNFSGDEDHNNYTFWGSELETIIRELAQYYDLFSGDYMENRSNNNKLRDIVEFPYMIRNKNHPWLLANVDGLINFDGEKADGIAECKTISRQSAEQWVGGIPTYYLYQVHHYMAVMEPILNENIAHIYVLQDGREFSCLPVRRSDVMHNAVMTESEKFWNLLEKGRDIMANATNDQQLQKGLEEIEPAPDSTKSYGAFISEQYKKKQEYINVQGTQEILDHARTYKEANKEIKKVNESKQFSVNTIKKFMNDNDADVVKFDNGSRITFNKRLYINLK